MTTTLPTSETTAADIHPLVVRRRSTRAFNADHRLADGEVERLLEAARWAASAINSQPWRFGVAHRGTPEFDALFASLYPGNQAWAGAASALVLVAARTVSEDGRALPTAAFDTGQAVALLSVQAEHDGLALHQMGGFDHDAAAAVFALPADTEPLVMIAVGEHDAGVALPEPFASRETAPRERKPVTELLLAPAA